MYENPTIGCFVARLRLAKTHQSLESHASLITRVFEYQSRSRSRIGWPCRSFGAIFRHFLQLMINGESLGTTETVLALTDDS